jgi:MerR family transcriptional regulator/heat shock protein HspR
MNMMVGIRRKAGRLPNGAIKIGTVARQFGISVDLLRLYEREGLLIPLKSPRGTRYYTEHDFIWIETILRLVRQARLNLASIRRLLALLPCWQLRNCPYDRRQDCPVMQDATQPCWVNRGHCQQLDARDCYFCVVYRSAPSCENLKALLTAPANQLAASRATAS